jgi:HlyD family secretion protein
MSEWRGTALAPVPVVDIKRQPRKKTGRYVMIAAGVVGLLLATVAISRLKPAAPTVQRAAQWIDVVRRGPMLRQVRGPGTLVPDSIRYVAPLTSGRVDRVHVRNGALVQAGQVLLEMSNPDEQLQLLSAEQQLSAAEAALVTMRTNLETSRLNQRATVATMRNLLRDTRRQLASAETLIVRNLIASNEVQRLRDQEQEYVERLEIEEARLELMTSTVDSQLTLQRGQIGRLEAIAASYRNRVAQMRVTAPTAGVVQDLNLQSGQWVQAGTTLARIVQPGKLRAELRIPETQARDVALGQAADIDTRIGIVRGRVQRIDPGAQSGTVLVEVALEGDLPQGARPDLSVEGVIEIERLDDVLFVGRPAYGQPNSPVGLFRLTEGGRYAERVTVRLGRASVNTVEVVGGLNQGDEVILSDMSRWDDVDRVRIK